MSATGTVGLCVRAIQGKSVGVPANLLPIVRGDHGTPNMRKAGAAGGLFSPEKATRDAAIATLDALLDSEECYGPAHWEFLCPDPHAGIYRIGEVTILLAGVKLGDKRILDLAERQAVLLGQTLRLLRLCATPDLQTAACGMRADPPPSAVDWYPAATGNDALLREVDRQPQRGQGGRTRKLESLQQLSELSGDNGMFYGPAWGFRELRAAARRADAAWAWALPGDAGAKNGPLPRLPLQATIRRWSSGYVMELADPGESNRQRYVIQGSKASGRDDDRDEDPLTFLRCDFAAPGHHLYRWAQSWETPPFDVVPSGAAVTVVGGGA